MYEWSKSVLKYSLNPFGIYEENNNNNNNNHNNHPNASHLSHSGSLDKSVISASSPTIPTYKKLYIEEEKKPPITRDLFNDFKKRRGSKQEYKKEEIEKIAKLVEILQLKIASADLSLVENNENATSLSNYIGSTTLSALGMITKPFTFGKKEVTENIRCEICR